MSFSKQLLISTLLIFINVLIGRYFPFASSFLVFLVAFIISSLPVKSNSQLYLKVFLVIVTILLNDITVKLFSGIMDDSEGEGVATLFLIATTIVTTVITMIVLIQGSPKKAIQVCAICLLIPISVGLYLCYLTR